MSVTIKYNGSNVATVEGGKTATLPVENKKMKTDIIVTVPESKGEVLPDHTESDFTLQLANIASGELGVVYSSTEKVSFEAAPSGKVIDTFVDTNFLPSNIKKDVEIFGVMGEYGGDETGGGSADDRVKYVTYMDRGAELIKYPVIEGDTARDPVAKGYIEKPTKEPTESTVYTQSGWSKTDGGAPDSTALQNVTEDRTVYAAYTESVRKYTIRFFDSDGSLIEEQQIAYGITPIIPERDNYIVVGITPELSPVTSDIDYYVQYIEAIELEDTSWARISELSAEGTAANYWAVGDTKSVKVNGTVGELNINKTYYVYILGFDHNSELEGTGIHFGTFKTAASSGTDICFVDDAYGISKTSTGFKGFNMSRGNSSNKGGWAGCGLRYRILGSTDVPPSDYDKTSLSTSNVGYDPTSTCTTNPVADTLMAALPSDLRAVMKPMTKYTDNKGNKSYDEANVTASIDYLPLLAEFEVFGKRTNANSYERYKQKQYDYFAAGNSWIKYKHTNVTSAGMYWLRSPRASTAYDFVKAGTDSYTDGSNFSYGLAPIFKV